MAYHSSYQDACFIIICDWQELLDQMLPRSVGKVLRAGGTVEPVMYDSVTIFFSDIHKFSNLITASSPFQVPLAPSFFCRDHSWEGLVPDHPDAQLGVQLLGRDPQPV